MARDFFVWYNYLMNDLGKKLLAIKEWLGTGSINIFGLPLSGKDTVGVRFAEAIGAKFLSSGFIIRAKSQEIGKDLTGSGSLIAIDLFFDIILPYFEREDLKPFPLILSSVGRWSGEETEVMTVAKNAGHEIKAAVLLQISEQDVLDRWESARLLGDRGDRTDDKDRKVFDHRIAEFREKTMPVIRHYQELGLLVKVKADQDKQAVLVDFINKLYDFSQSSH